MVNLKINGQMRSLDVPDEMPLLWALRDVLQLTGSKYGCGIGSCGACSVLMGDRVVRSCQISVSAVVGEDITTIEGLSPDNSHPLQKAWIATDVAQCGYCQAGQIMTAAALLRRVAKPSDEDIDEALRSNLCRCGTYTRIREAIHLATE